MTYFSLICRFNLQIYAYYSKMCSVPFPKMLITCSPTIHRFVVVKKVLLIGTMPINWGVDVETFYSIMPF